MSSDLSWLVSSVAASGVASALRSASDKLRLFSLFPNPIKKHFALSQHSRLSQLCLRRQVRRLRLMFSILRRYPSTPPSSKWWQSPIPRNEEGHIVIVQDIDKEYAACVYRKIRHEWPYYKQVVAQSQYRHIYACCDSSIDDCHHMLTPEGELCHCQRWKQLWDQDVFENYRVG